MATLETKNVHSAKSMFFEIFSNCNYCCNKLDALFFPIFSLLCDRFNFIKKIIYNHDKIQTNLIFRMILKNFPNMGTFLKVDIVNCCCQSKYVSNVLMKWYICVAKKCVLKLIKLIKIYADELSNYLKII